MERQELPALWARYLATRSDANRNLLAEHYLPLVERLAAKLKTRLPANVELGDLVSGGSLGLLDAITRFEPARGYKFETFCVRRVQGAMLDGLRALDWVPRLVRKRATILKTAGEKLVQKLGREPTVAELARGLKLKVADVEALQRETQPVQSVSLSSKKFETDCGRELILQDLVIAGPQADPGRRSAGEDILRILTKSLDRESRLVVIMYYFEELSMKEIGAQLGLSESRISQLHKQILEGLRRRLESRRGEIAA